MILHQVQFDGLHTAVVAACVNLCKTVDRLQGALRGLTEQDPGPKNMLM